MAVYGSMFRIFSLGNLKVASSLVMSSFLSSLKLERNVFFFKLLVSMLGLGNSDWDRLF